MGLSYLQTILTQTEKFARPILTELNTKYVYHNLTHTEDVLAMVQKLVMEHNRICQEGQNHQARVSDDQMFLLQIATWFHDLGFIKKYVEHEKVGADIAAKQLQVWGCPEIEIQIIKDMILATKLPQKPKTFLAQILCDADVANFGRADFFTLGELVRQELVGQGTTRFQNLQVWQAHSLLMLQKHTFHTLAARNLFTKDSCTISQALTSHPPDSPNPLPKYP